MLRNINRGMPDALQNRYRELIAGRRAETLTESEHAELLHLTNQVEKYDIERLKYLTELARIRKISLTELLDELSIEPAYTLSCEHETETSCYSSCRKILSKIACIGKHKKPNGLLQTVGLFLLEPQ